MNWVLTQKILALGKLPVKLVIQVVAICDNYDGRAIQSILQTMGIKHHRQRFAAALCMPEYTTLAVCLRCVFRGKYCLIDSKILVITC